MTRILGIDYGIKRIGVATADTESRIATPMTTLDGRNDVTRDARNVADLSPDEPIGSFVVGLPLNMDDSEGLQAELTRRFAAELERLSRRPVHLHDERLSSFAAEEALDSTGLRGRRRTGLVDRIAAQKILQSYLDAQ